jgi:hypothetical protein
VILFNPDTKPVEFRYGGQIFIFKPKESRNLPDEVALHALERQHAPLVEHTPMYDKQVAFSDTVYSELPWRKLVSMASARGIFKPGSSRAEVEKNMEEYDQSQGRTL